MNTNHVAQQRESLLHIQTELDGLVNGRVQESARKIVQAIIRKDMAGIRRSVHIGNQYWENLELLKEIERQYCAYFHQDADMEEIMQIVGLYRAGGWLEEWRERETEIVIWPIASDGNHSSGFGWPERQDVDCLIDTHVIEPAEEWQETSNPGQTKRKLRVSQPGSIFIPRPEEEMLLYLKHCGVTSQSAPETSEGF